jgi:phenylpropionate dioxygenase-like ring-hydroxylating dioxygenase large terminal subunit
MSDTLPRSSGPAYGELLDGDSRPVNPVLRLAGIHDIGPVTIPASRYTDQATFDAEVEHIWKKTWQMACREEHIPNVGDAHVYDIAGISILVVRAAPNRIKAYHNACLHRGRALATVDGNVGEVIRCPFHGLEWHHDGTLAQLTTPWDFPHVSADQFSLPEVQVGRWEGWVFVNLDPNAASLETYLGDLPRHFAKWSPGTKYVSAHVGKVFPVNWKVAQEAFMEAMHVIATHPQIMASIGDANSQYDAFGNFSRAVSAGAVASPHLRWTPTEQQIFDSLTDRRLDQESLAQVPDGMTARAFAAQGGRRRLSRAVDGIDSYCDAELVDSIYYTLFPNFHPWGAFNRINYRFRPLGRQVDHCVMECIFTDNFSGDRPPPAPYRLLGLEDEWVDAAPELGMLARVFQQDSFNLPAVQQGLETMAARGGSLTLTRYQELKVRHFHHLWEAHLAGAGPGAATPVNLPTPR